MAKIGMAGLAVGLCLAILLSGCTDAPGGSTVTPAGCGDRFCGAGETPQNCPLDCRTSSSNGGGYTGGDFDAPELGVTIDDTGIPDRLEPGEQALLLIRVENLAPQSMNDEDNQRMTIRNVQVSLYNFGDFIGCTPAVFEFSSLIPEEEREVTCTVTAPNKEITQSIKIRTFYTYDLYASLDAIKVLSKEEYSRERPSTDIIESEVSGPLSMMLSASKVPVQSGRPITMAVDLEASVPGDGGIVEKSDFGNKYHIELLQVQIPEGFIVSSTGSFIQEGNTLTASRVKLLDEKRTLSFSLTAPELSVPEETFSLSAVATGFEVFTNEKIDLKVVSPE